MTYKTYKTYKTGALGAVWGMCCGVSAAHGSLYALCHYPVFPATLPLLNFASHSLNSLFFNILLAFSKKRHILSLT